MIKSHIIWGDYPETEDLIKKLQRIDISIITVVDEKMKNGLNRFEDIVYASKEYVEAARFDHVPEFHYYYIPRSERTDGVAWKIKKVIGLVNEFHTHI